jgi:hypothetical protein
VTGLNFDHDGVVIRPGHGRRRDDPADLLIAVAGDVPPIETGRGDVLTATLIHVRVITRVESCNVRRGLRSQHVIRDGIDEPPGL